MEIQQGIGRITSSSTTVQGHFTEFMKQLSVGDAIIITHPTRYATWCLWYHRIIYFMHSLLEETKVVRMVLSNVSIGISSAFSSDLVSTTSFK